MSRNFAFKTAARRAILSLPTASEGFGFADVARVLGRAYGRPGGPQRRLRRYMEARVIDGGLERLRQGRYRVDKLAGSDAHTLAIDLEVRIAQALFDAGGVMAPGDLLVAIGRDTEGEDRYVREVLKASHLFIADLSRVPGHCRDWRLVDRSRVPVPGRLLSFELLMEAGGRWDPHHLHRVQERRAQIARALAEARVGAGLTVAEVVAAAGIANALAWDLYKSDVPAWTDGRWATLSHWWRAEEERGLESASDAAWTALETEGEPHLMAVSVAFWIAVGERLGVDPARLSRGEVVRAPESEEEDLA